MQVAIVGAIHLRLISGITLCFRIFLSGFAEVEGYDGVCPGFSTLASIIFLQELNVPAKKRIMSIDTYFIGAVSKLLERTSAHEVSCSVFLFQIAALT